MRVTKRLRTSLMPNAIGPRTQPMAPDDKLPMPPLFRVSENSALRTTTRRNQAHCPSGNARERNHRLVAIDGLT